MKKHQLLVALSCCMLFLFSCKKETQVQQTMLPSSMEEMMAEGGANPDEAVFSTQRIVPSKESLYTESNAAGGNSILIYDKNEDGTLQFRTEVQSGGMGSGEGLGSQGALTFSDDKKWLFAVNAGSNTFSAFRVADNGDLKLVSTVSSKGTLPVSLTTHGRMIYVLNNLSANISGFTYTDDGMLVETGGTPHALSAADADPAEVKFSGDGQTIYVTEKKTNIIDAFSIDAGGNITGVVHNPSKGVEPFGFSIGRNNFLIVSNAANGFSGAGSCTSYGDDGQGNLQTINGPVSNYQSAPCWVATGKFGVFAFISNTATNNISSYYMDRKGELFLVNSYAAAAGEAPIDIIVSNDNYYVYNINSGSHSISSYIRVAGGEIKPVEKMTGLPEFAAGLVMR